MTMYPLITAEQYAADRARHAERLPCKCGTRLAVQIVCRQMPGLPQDEHGDVLCRQDHPAP